MKRIPLVLGVLTLLAMTSHADTQERLEACREQIDGLDQHIVQLVQERAQVVQKVGNIEREAHLPVTVLAICAPTAGYQRESSARRGTE